MPPNSLGTLQPPPYQMNKAPQPGMDPVLPPQQPAKIKKGVKRKADTTTPANSFESPYALADPAKSAKIATRRESGRQVMKVGGLLASRLLFLLTNARLLSASLLIFFIHFIFVFTISNLNFSTFFFN